ncbi:transferrin-binding protein-like solute binding protein [Arcobacter sp. CECT 8983]|uniref:transferrin-binding protein-like solute binding protein n=1 Tax=Arcobacter sp. CECT 8983 TaxID=2044508 RepID=UPI0013E98B40|nr:transferrin-binding protein-like solute binding protein [Arcobacter sp. CECT 8983]
MKKIALIFLTLSTLLFAEVAKVVALKGEAYIKRGDSNIILKLNSLLEKNDIIKTKESTKLQLLFKDETIITIGKNSTLAVNDYIFDEQKKEYKAEFGLLKGTFRTITGKIGKIAPDKFKLKSKASSIGIRGTQILSNMEISGDTIFCTEGTITIVSNFTGETITINAGQYVTVKEGEPMSVQDFDSKTIQETDKETKFLNDEEKESALNKFGVELISAQENNEPENPFNPESPRKPHKVDPTNDIDTTNVLIGEVLEFDSNNYSKGTLNKESSNLSSGNNYSYNLTLNNLSKNFDKDGSYSGTLSSRGQFLYDGNIHTFKNGTYTSTKDSLVSSTPAYDTDDYVQWGEWNATTEYNSEEITLSGYWLTGIQTPSSEIESLISSNANYSYSGYALGQSSVNDIINVNNSTVTFDIDFGGKSLTGRFNLGSFSTDVSGTLSSSGFSFTPTTGTITGEGSGKFFGPNAKSVGGNFKFDGNATYTGVFKATR